MRSAYPNSEGGIACEKNGVRHLDFFHIFRPVRLQNPANDAIRRPRGHRYYHNLSKRPYAVQPSLHQHHKNASDLKLSAVDRPLWNTYGRSGNYGGQSISNRHAIFRRQRKGIQTKSRSVYADRQQRLATHRPPKSHDAKSNGWANGQR